MGPRTRSAPPRRRDLPLGALLAAAVAAAPCAAQNAPASEKRDASAQAISLGDKLAPEHLLGDWRGLRPRLADRGVDLTLSYLSETAGVVSGGRRTGVDYAHDISLRVDVDGAKLAGIPGFSAHLALVERAGRSTSADYVGERITQVQEIYGSGGQVAAHLAYLYGEESLFDGKVDVKAGRLDVGEDFANSPLYCEFMTLSVCPSPRQLSILSGFTIYPTSTWGGRVRVQPGGSVYVQAGAFQVRTGLGGGRSGFDFSTSRTTGAMLPLEIGAEPRWGPSKLVGHYKLGVTYNTSRFDDLWESRAGRTPLATAAGGDARSHRGQAAVYVAADQMLKRTGPNGVDGVILLAGWSHADPHTAILSDQAFGGVLASGVVPGRPRDSVGVQATWLQVSSQLTAVQRLQAALGQALSAGSSALASPPAGVETHEWVLEGRYDVALREGLHLMPDLQYVIHPDAVRTSRDAVVLGLRLTVDL